ncbi:MAG TPA: hypothetical protein VIT42_18970, partial [Microlunatus sp.]
TVLRITGRAFFGDRSACLVGRACAGVGGPVPCREDLIEGGVSALRIDPEGPELLPRSSA